VTVIGLLKMSALSPVSCLSTDHLEYDVWTLAARIFPSNPDRLSKIGSMVHCAVSATI